MHASTLQLLYVLLIRYMSSIYANQVYLRLYLSDTCLYFAEIQQVNFLVLTYKLVYIEQCKTFTSFFNASVCSKHNFQGILQNA